MDAIAQQTSTSAKPQGMRSLEQIVENLQNEAQKAQESRTTTVDVNGRICNIVAACAGKKSKSQLNTPIPP
jgi:hypothetical protein